MSAKLRKSNPEAFQNILKRMLEAKGRGYWDPDDEVRLADFFSGCDFTRARGGGVNGYLVARWKNRLVVVIFRFFWCQYDTATSICARCGRWWHRRGFDSFTAVVRFRGTECFGVNK